MNKLIKRTNITYAQKGTKVKQPFTDAFTNIATKWTGNPEYGMGTDSLISPTDVLSKDTNLTEYQRSGIDYANYWYSQPEAHRRAKALYRRKMSGWGDPTDEEVENNYRNHFNGDRISINQMIDVTDSNSPEGKLLDSNNAAGLFDGSRILLQRGGGSRENEASNALHEYSHENGTEGAHMGIQLKPDLTTREANPKKWDYVIGTQSEVYPRIMELRMSKGLKNDGVPISPEQVEEWRKSNDNFEFTEDYKKQNSLFNFYSNEKIAEMLNTMVSTKKTSDAVYARKGIKLIKKKL